MYTIELRDEISQGDVFSNFPVMDFDYNASDLDLIATKIRRSLVVLLSNDCDYDNCKYIMVAEIRLLSNVKYEHQDNIKNGKSRRTFYLQGIPNILDESYIDFRHIHRVDKRFISECPDNHIRIASLNDNERLALQRSIAIFFGIVPNIE